MDESTSDFWRRELADTHLRLRYMDESLFSCSGCFVALLLVFVVIVAFGAFLGILGGVISTVFGLFAAIPGWVWLVIVVVAVVMWQRRGR